MMGDASSTDLNTAVTVPAEDVQEESITGQSAPQTGSPLPSSSQESGKPTVIPPRSTLWRKELDEHGKVHWNPITPKPSVIVNAASKPAPQTPTSRIHVKDIVKSKFETERISGALDQENSPHSALRILSTAMPLIPSKLQHSFPASSLESPNWSEEVSLDSMHSPYSDAVSNMTPQHLLKELSRSLPTDYSKYTPPKPPTFSLSTKSFTNSVHIDNSTDPFAASPKKTVPGDATSLFAQLGAASGLTSDNPTSSLPPLPEKSADQLQPLATSHHVKLPSVSRIPRLVPTATSGSQGTATTSSTSSITLKPTQQSKENTEPKVEHVAATKKDEHLPPSSPIPAKQRNILAEPNWSKLALSPGFQAKLSRETSQRLQVTPQLNADILSDEYLDNMLRHSEALIESLMKPSTPVPDFRDESLPNIEGISTGSINFVQNATAKSAEEPKEVGKVEEKNTSNVINLSQETPQMIPAILQAREEILSDEFLDNMLRRSEAMIESVTKPSTQTPDLLDESLPNIGTTSSLSFAKNDIALSAEEEPKEESDVGGNNISNVTIQDGAVDHPSLKMDISDIHLTQSTIKLSCSDVQVENSIDVAPLELKDLDTLDVSAILAQLPAVETPTLFNSKEHEGSSHSAFRASLVSFADAVTAAEPSSTVLQADISTFSFDVETEQIRNDFDGEEPLRGSLGPSGPALRLTRFIGEDDLFQMKSSARSSKSASQGMEPDESRSRTGSQRNDQHSKSSSNHPLRNDSSESADGSCNDRPGDGKKKQPEPAKDGSGDKDSPSPRRPIEFDSPLARAVAKAQKEARAQVQMIRRRIEKGVSVPLNGDVETVMDQEYASILESVQELKKFVKERKSQLEEQSVEGKKHNDGIAELSAKLKNLKEETSMLQDEIAKKNAARRTEQPKKPIVEEKKPISIIKNNKSVVMSVVRKLVMYTAMFSTVVFVAVCMASWMAYRRRLEHFRLYGGPNRLMHASAHEPSMTEQLGPESASMFFDTVHSFLDALYDTFLGGGDGGDGGRAAITPM